MAGSVSQEGAREGDALQPYGESLQRVEPEAGRGVYALSVAMDILESARQKAADSRFDDAIVLCRDSMRMASSALLFEDGVVAGDLEASCDYISRKYGDSVPTGEWKAVESMALTGPADRILAVFGRSGGTAGQKAKAVLESAFRFIGAVSEIMRPAAQELAKEMAEAAPGGEAGEPDEEAGEETESGGPQDSDEPDADTEEDYGVAS